MPNTRISGADTTAIKDIDYKESHTYLNQSFDYLIDYAQEPVLEYTPNWAKWAGIYNTIPELQASIDKKAMWTIGKGFITDKKTKLILDKIRGAGKDTFNTIINNNIRTYTICGDSFCEIIKNKRGELINLKPLSPSTLKIVGNSQGLITRYEQTLISPTGQKSVKLFKPEDIFHLSWQRLGSAINGIGTIEKLEQVITASKEAMEDLRTVFHRYVKPLWVVSVDTDDTTEIAAFKTKLDNTIKNAENMIVPKDTVDSIERVSIPQYSTLDPLPWLKMLQEYFLIAEGVPEVILGYGRDTTEASAKILYLAFQQMIEFNQDFLHEQIKAQLKIDVKFKFPASLAPDIQNDQKKDGDQKTKQFKDANTNTRE